MKRAVCVLLVLACAAGLGLAARFCVVSTVRITGSSMAETLRGGDIVLTLRRPFEPEFGDVVECRFPNRSDAYVKRVVGLPGDRIVFSEGMLTRSGEPVSEPYVSSPTEDFEIEVAEDRYLVLGDNRADSYDGRAEDMGLISREEITGRVVWILWPLSRFGPV